MTEHPKKHSEREGTPSLNNFGPHFRLWREKRGYSLKEAAGDILAISEIVYAVKHFSASELYVQAQDLINKARDIVHQFPLASNLLLVRMVELDMEEVFLLLRKNDLKAIKMAEELISMLDQLHTFFPHNNWQLSKQSFIHGVNLFNKTGKLLYED